jgi:hypothetical protein
MLVALRLLVAPVRMTELEPRRVVAVGVALYASIFSFVPVTAISPSALTRLINLISYPWHHFPDLTLECRGNTKCWPLWAPARL